MYIIISIIENLKIENDIPEMDLFLGINKLSQVPSSAIKYFGEQLVKRISENTVYFKVFKEISGDPSDFLYLQSSKMQSKLIFPIWLLEDNSVFSCFSYLICDERNILRSDFNNVFLSRSDGLYGQTSMNKDKYGFISNLLKNFDLLFEKENFVKIEQKNSIRAYSNNSIDYSLTSKFKRAFTFLNYARQTIDILTKISWYIVAIEAIFGDEDNTNDLSFKLSYRIPLFLKNDKEDRILLAKLITDSYNIRSRFLHGSKDKKLKLSEFNNKIDLSINLDIVVRESLLKILSDKELITIFLTKEKLKNYFHNLLL